MMRDGSRVITLIDQFDKVLDLAGIDHAARARLDRQRRCCRAANHLAPLCSSLAREARSRPIL
jgi:hypothetical protein